MKKKLTYDFHNPRYPNELLTNFMKSFKLIFQITDNQCISWRIT